MKLPIEFEDRMKKLLGSDWEDFLFSYNNNKYQALRFNILKLNDNSNEEDILIKLGIQKKDLVEWAEDAYYYDSSDESVRPGKHPFHEMGLYYIQEPSAMSPAAMLSPKPGMRVLDLCAAPGGKSTQLASYLKGNGLLVSNEINPQRCRVLSQNIERMGITNAIVTNEDSASLAAHFPAFFHAIAVDAPCSGEGMFRKLPEAIDEWSPQNVKNCATRQKEILSNAAHMLAPGGTIVYSTCTFSKEENEDVIEDFLASHLDFCLEKSFRFWPHKNRGEGHFAAKLVRDGELRYDESKIAIDKSSDTLKKVKVDFSLLDEFLEETLTKEKAAWIKNGHLMMFGDNLYRLPDEAVDIKGLKVLRAGLQIGQFKKNRFEPSHSLAMALSRNDVKNYINLALDSSETIGFFEGLSITVDDALKCNKGWSLVCIDGYSAGWGKVSQNQIKNHYPKGLRTQVQIYPCKK